MSQILQITFPFFGLVLCGYVVGRARALPLESIPGLNGFVLYFALPSMLYRFAANTPIVRLLDPGVCGVYLVCALLLAALTVLLTRRGAIGWNDAAFGALVAAFPNSGFMGVPLLVALLGQQAAAPAIVALALDMVVTSSLCLALSRLDSGGEHGASRAVSNALAGMVKNPLPWAIALGCLTTATGWPLWEPARRTVDLLADGASPVALFTIGAVLARSQHIAALHEHGPMPPRDYVPVAVVKLVAHPLLVWGVGHLAIVAGVPLRTESLTVMVLVAALPSASNVSLLAERFGADTGRIARIILLTTAAAFLTFSSAVALLK